ncbi:MAG TPA: hypothetical protein VHV31_01815, partial [Nitrolancea sp.]|nr:hypothetical protein [Nitrolancea sp.]
MPPRRKTSKDRSAKPTTDEHRSQSPVSRRALLVGGFTVAAFIVDRSLRRPPHPKHDQPTSISEVTIVSADANSSEPESTDVPTASTAGDIVFIDP